MKANGTKSVLVTTAHKGVFFGQLVSKPGETLTLKNARCCIYWSAGTAGFLGLAEKGPQPGSRVGPAVPSLTLYGVTSISDVTAEAEKKWEAASWKP